MLGQRDHHCFFLSLGEKKKEKKKILFQMITVGFRGGGGGQGPETLAFLCNFLLACLGRGASLLHQFCKEADRSRTRRPPRSRWRPVAGSRVGTAVLGVPPCTRAHFPAAVVASLCPVSAAARGELCCDVQQAWVWQRERARAPPFHPHLCSALCTLCPHCLYLILKSVYCKEAGCKIDTILNCAVI